ncbi:MAG TPA: hypothetical protein VIH28_08280 [Ignavibacteriaceae bacterium]
MKKTISELTGKKMKLWEPTYEQAIFIKERYATYNSINTWTKSRICERFKVSSAVLDRYLAKHNIKPKKEPKGKSRDLTGFIRIPVPCEFGSQTYILIPPDKDPVEALENYKKRNEEKLKRFKKKEVEGVDDLEI